MTIVVHGARGSGSSIVEMALAELGLAYEVHDLDAKGNEHRGDAYAAINPQRKMPAVEIDGEILTESVAILVTLDERYGDGGARLLPPRGSKERAQALRWMLVFATELYPIVEIMDYPERFAPASERDAIHERANEIWRGRWLTIEQQIAGPEYFLGAFSAVDLQAAVLSRWDLGAEWRKEHLPKVDALAEAVRARPAIQRVWARHFPR